MWSRANMVSEDGAEHGHQRFTMRRGRNTEKKIDRWRFCLCYIDLDQPYTVGEFALYRFRGQY